MTRRILALALLAPFLVGCHLIYKSKAAKWGESLGVIQTKLDSVNAEAARVGMKLVTDRDTKDGVLADLDEIQGLISELELKVGTGGHPAHGDLLDGLRLLSDAIDAFVEMIDFSNQSKRQEYEELAREAKAKLQSWANAVRGPQTG